MFLPLQEAAVKALSADAHWFARQNEIYLSRQKKVFALLDLLDCVYDSAQTGMFVWARVPASVESGYALSDQVLDENAVFITPGGIFGTQGNGYVRISLCAKEEVFQTAGSLIEKRRFYIGQQESLQRQNARVNRNTQLADRAINEC
jgi:aspartate/methionine/tyrosine aminotransferase